jgi:hypothetical protein
MPAAAVRVTANIGILTAVSNGFVEFLQIAIIMATSRPVEQGEQARRVPVPAAAVHAPCGEQLMKLKTAWLAIVPAVVALSDCRLARALPDAVQSFTFSQTGYSEGAMVSGAFSGVDLDGNGILAHFPGQSAPPLNVFELTAFSMHFSGNSLAPPFDLALDDLYGFVYQLGTNGIGDDPALDPDFGELMEGIGAIGTNFFYTSGIGPNAIIGGYVGGQIDFEDLINVDELALDTSANLVLVTPVPEPPGLALLAGAALSIAGRRRRAMAS